MEALLIAALKRCATQRLLGGPKVKSSIKVNGSGQECPLHTGNVKVKSGAAGFRGSHLSQRTRKMGHPL
jgi:hypothetical protein